MIKILVNAPKGGVGKTTLATNIALYLARIGKRVWALDLAQGEQMTKELIKTDFFNSSQTVNKIETRELESIPRNFRGARQFDVLVADTDDYLEIIKDLARHGISNAWKVVVPVVDEYNGLQRIPNEIKALLLTINFRGNSTLNLKMIPNKVENNDSIENIKSKLSEHGVEGYLCDCYISYCDATPPFYINDTDFNNEITDLLKEIGVI